MATISNTPRPGYVWDSTDNVWYPIGTGPHSHADYITAGSAINPNIVDAKGDIIAATAADTVARLAVGSNDQVLTADSSTATGLKWATPAAGGMTLISTTTLTGASVTLSSIPGTYNNLYLVVRNWLPATDNTEFGLRFNADSTANRHRDVGFGVTQINTTLTFTATYINFNCGQDNGVSTSLIVAQIPDYANTTTWKKVTYETLTVDPTTTTSFRQSLGMGIYNQTSAITSLELFSASGNFTSGTALLYGVK